MPNNEEFLANKCSVLQQLIHIQDIKSAIDKAFEAFFATEEGTYVLIMRQELAKREAAHEAFKKELLSKNGKECLDFLKEIK
jgi:hypothetical protein